MSRLSERLTLLTSSHAQGSATLESLARERQELEDKEKEIRVMIEKAEKKRAWFDSFKDWVESVAAFLDEKVKVICFILI
jgi:GC-rich sequence DNA-binding factor